MFSLLRARTAVLVLLLAAGTFVVLTGATASAARAAEPALAAGQAGGGGISKSRADALGSGGRHMSSDVTWYAAADGRPDRLVGTTKTWNNVKLTGFTGSVIVLFVNERGQTVGYSPVKYPLGVDGKWIGRWSRTDAWQFDIDPEQTRGAVGIEVVHSRGQVDRVEKVVDTAKKVAGVVMLVRMTVSG